MPTERRFGGWVYVAGGDIDNDGKAEIAGAGPGGAPHVQVFSGQLSNAVIDSFVAHAPSFSGGVFPASAP